MSVTNCDWVCTVTVWSGFQLTSRVNEVWKIWKKIEKFPYPAMTFLIVKKTLWNKIYLIHIIQNQIFLFIWMSEKVVFFGRIQKVFCRAPFLSPFPIEFRPLVRRRSFFTPRFILLHACFCLILCKHHKLAGIRLVQDDVTLLCSGLW